jgi:hypothetical protein
MRTLLASNILTSNTASVTFSSINQGQTDLYLRCLVRSTSATTTSADSFRLTLNGNSGSIYSFTSLNDFNTGFNSSQSSAAAPPTFYGVASDGYSGAGTYTYIDFWIPSYTSTNAGLRQIGIDLGTADSTTDSKGQMLKTALWFNSSAAISSINLTLFSGASFKTGSAFYLLAQRNS